MPAIFTPTQPDLDKSRLHDNDNGAGRRPPTDKRTGGGGEGDNWQSRPQGSRGPRERLGRYRMGLFFALAGGVNEPQWKSAHAARCLDQVARGAGRRRDDRTVLAQERVEQAGLAHIGRAHDGGQGALLEHAAQRRGAKQLGDLRLDACQAQREVRTKTGLDSLFREIEAGLEVAEEIDKFRPQPLQRLTEPALFHRTGAGQGALCWRIEKIEQAFRLGER